MLLATFPLARFIFLIVCFSFIETRRQKSGLLAVLCAEGIYDNKYREIVNYLSCLKLMHCKLLLYILKSCQCF